jgi:hypothetical protein
METRLKNTTRDEGNQGGQPSGKGAAKKERPWPQLIPKVFSRRQPAEG